MIYPKQAFIDIWKLPSTFEKLKIMKNDDELKSLYT